MPFYAQLTPRAQHRVDGAQASRPPLASARGHPPVGTRAQSPVPRITQTRAPRPGGGGAAAMRGPQRSGVGAVVLCLLCARLAAGSDDLFGVDYKRDNLIRNGDFELSLSRMTALFWQPFVFDFPYVTSRRSHGGIRSAMLSVANHSDSSNDAWRGIGQYIYVNQTVVVDLVRGGGRPARRPLADPIRRRCGPPQEISAWASGFALSEPARVFCDLKYSDKTWDLDKTLVFPAGRFQWERRSMMLSPAKVRSLAAAAHRPRSANSAPRSRSRPPSCTSSSSAKRAPPPSSTTSRSWSGPTCRCPPPRQRSPR